MDREIMINHIACDSQNNWVTAYKGDSEPPVLQIRVENEVPEITGWIAKRPFTVHFESIEKAVDAAIGFLTETSWFFVLESYVDSEEWEDYVK